MTDTQILTLVLPLSGALILPLGMLLYSNSRITDVNSSITGAKETLRAEMKTSHVEVMAAITAVSVKLDLMEQDLKHFFKIIENHEGRVTKLEHGK